MLLRVNLPVVDTIHPQFNKFVKVLNLEATGNAKLNDIAEIIVQLHNYSLVLFGFKLTGN